MKGFKQLTHYTIKTGYVAGCDEAGRGCLAGPVFAAAVVLPEDPSKELREWLHDSKKLPASRRHLLRKLIEEQAVACGIAMVDHDEIDRINILQASIKAMHLALRQLAPQPDFILVDGNRFIPYGFTPYQCVVKGDNTWLCIAAASVMAKTARDAHMLKLHGVYPLYGWDQNKGYPTRQHREAIKNKGPSPIHRKTFRL